MGTKILHYAKYLGVPPRPDGVNPFVVTTPLSDGGNSNFNPAEGDPRALWAGGIMAVDHWWALVDMENDTERVPW